MTKDDGFDVVPSGGTGRPSGQSSDGGGVPSPVLPAPSPLPPASRPPAPPAWPVPRLSMRPGDEAHRIVTRLGRIRRAMTRRAATRPVRLTVAYHAVLLGVSFVGSIVAMVVAIMRTPGLLGMSDQKLEEVTGGWIGPLSLATSLLAFLFVALMRRREIGTRAFWFGGRSTVRLPRAAAATPPGPYGPYGSYAAPAAP
ncbi:hypothetical protein H7U32_09345, partial [Bifidobacterium pullorum subsp. saeculare]